uniref:Uncharacterized protein n=1 Tax=Vespula pensylvanica TaxID=30213 RepID=A0A834U4N5_VESPE|nr:hypothetical protein H0235_011082 [Vespula pensylvanica]
MTLQQCRRPCSTKNELTDNGSTVFAIENVKNLYGNTINPNLDKNVNRTVEPTKCDWKSITTPATKFDCGERRISCSFLETVHFLLSNRAKKSSGFDSASRRLHLFDVETRNSIYFKSTVKLLD